MTGADAAYGRSPLVRRTVGRPSRDALRDTPIHGIARDYPETLRLFRARALDPTEHGAVSPGRLDDIDVDGLIDDLLDAVGWRPG